MGSPTEVLTTGIQHRIQIIGHDVYGKATGEHINKVRYKNQLQHLTNCFRSKTKIKEALQS